jgi:hypothetical protein
MTRPLSQRLCEHEDGRHTITDPCLTFAVCSEILSLWRFQDILACGTMNRPAGDLAGDAFLDTVRRAGQIQLAPSNPSPFFKKQPCITHWSGTIHRLYWQSAVVNRMDSEAYGITH